MRSICTFYIFLSALAWSETAESLFASANHAIDSGLWDVAALRLESATESKTLPEKKQADALLLLAESLVRGNQPDRALAVLENSLIRENPVTSFWHGQALAGKGRYSDAINSLLPVAGNPETPLQTEAALTISSLRLSLGQTAESLATLDLLDDPELSTKSFPARLKRIEILLDLDRIAQARNIFPKKENIPEKFAPLARFLDAAILLAAGKANAAAPLFKELAADPQGQTMQNYNQAALGYADSLAAQGNTEAATSSLLAFIRKNPDSPLLAPIFQRIIDWFPDIIISEENQTLVKISEWLPQIAPLGTGLINTRSVSATATFPTASRELTDLEVFSLHASALGLHRIKTERAQSRAASLLQRIRLLAPRHFLTPRSLLESGKWQLSKGNTAQALATFRSLSETTTSPILKGESAFLAAGIAFENKDFTLATALFNDAATLLTGENANSASINSALAKLEQDPTATILINTENPETDSPLNTDLELERALVTKNPAEARTALDKFLIANPDHPRTAEARLAIAAAALATSPPDLPAARAQLEILASTTGNSPTSPEYALTRLRLLDLSEETDATIAAAKQITSDFPNTSAASEASLVLGKTFFSTGNYNDARLVLEKLAAAEPGTQRSQAALLLAARSAALGATEQSREEALALFDKTIAIEGPLTALAKLEKARLNISLNRLQQAIDSLDTAYQSLSKQNPARMPTGLLLAEAIYAQGDSDPENLGKTLKIYSDLLENSPADSSRNFRIQYLRGLTLEKLPNPEKPDQTRTDEALSAYFSVIDRPTDPPPPEWEWFYKSGFRALLILENQERWQAAISLAEKIASFGGPRTADAATRARQLRLKHMIWED